MRESRCQREVASLLPRPISQPAERGLRTCQVHAPAQTPTGTGDRETETETDRSFLRTEMSGLEESLSG